MAQVMMPQRQNKTAQMLPAVGTLAGAAAGAYMGSGNPAAIGLGASLGGAAGGLAAQGSEGEQGPQPLASTNGSQAGAMQRRQQQLAEDRLATLQNAEQNLAQMPEPVRQEYGPAIIQARLMEQRQRGMA